MYKQFRTNCFLQVRGLAKKQQILDFHLSDQQNIISSLLKVLLAKYIT